MFDMFKGTFHLDFFNVPPRVLPALWGALFHLYFSWLWTSRPGVRCKGRRETNTPQVHLWLCQVSRGYPELITPSWGRCRRLGPVQEAFPLALCSAAKAAGLPGGIPQGKKPAARPPPCFWSRAGKSRFCCSFSSEPPIRSLPGDISLERTPSPSSPVPNVKQTGRQCSWKPPRLLGGASASEGRWEGDWGVRARGAFIGAQSHSHGCSGGPAEGKGLELPPPDLFPGSAVLFLLLPDGLQSRLGGGGRFAWQALLV